MMQRQELGRIKFLYCPTSRPSKVSFPSPIFSYLAPSHPAPRPLNPAKPPRLGSLMWWTKSVSVHHRWPQGTLVTPMHQCRVERVEKHIDDAMIAENLTTAPKFSGKPLAWPWRKKWYRILQEIVTICNTLCQLFFKKTETHAPCGRGI